MTSSFRIMKNFMKNLDAKTWRIGAIPMVTWLKAPQTGAIRTLTWIARIHSHTYINTVTTTWCEAPVQLLFVSACWVFSCLFINYTFTIRTDWKVSGNPPFNSHPFREPDHRGGLMTKMAQTEMAQTKMAYTNMAQMKMAQTKLAR